MATSCLHRFWALIVATELFSILCPHSPGWRSQRPGFGYQVSAELGDVDIWYRGPTIEGVERAYYRACMRTFLRRMFPWIRPPPRELDLHFLAFSLAGPSDLHPAFFDACAGMNARSVSIGPNRRPGDEAYWIALIYDLDGKRHGLGTPQFRNLSLEEQAPNLCQQLRTLAQELTGDSSHG
jgi:hypothetical protein